MPRKSVKKVVRKKASRKKAAKKKPVEEEPQELEDEQDDLEDEAADNEDETEDDDEGLDDDHEEDDPVSNDLAHASEELSHIDPNKMKDDSLSHHEEEADEELHEDKEDDPEEDSKEDDETVAPREEQLEDEEEKHEQKIRALPYTFLLFGVSMFCFLIMSALLVYIPYYIVDFAAYPIIIGVSLALAALSYWVVARATDSPHATAWGGVLIPVLPLAAIIFIQRVFIELATHKAEIVEASGRAIPELFAPLFTTIFPLPVVISISFYFFYVIIFFIFLLRKRAKAIWLLLLTPVIFVAVWFLLNPLISKAITFWVTYIKGL